MDYASTQYNCKIIEYNENIEEVKKLVFKNSFGTYNNKLKYYLGIINDFDINDIVKHKGIELLKESNGLYSLKFKLSKNIRVLITIKMLFPRVKFLNKEISIVCCFLRILERKIGILMINI